MMVNIKNQISNIKNRALTILFVWAALCVVNTAARAEEITILFTGDTHGMIYPCSCPVEPDGGIGRRASYIKEERQKNPGLLLLDSGGFIAGGVLDDYSQNAELDMERTRINLKAMALMRYDAMGLGGDEFNFGERFLSENTAGNKLPLLSCNVYPKNYPVKEDSADAPAYVRRYLVKDQAGIRIGILGVTPPQAVQKAPGIIILEPKSAISRYVRQLRKEGVDIIVLLSRLGENEDQRLQMEIPGVDILIGGYGSHDKETVSKTGAGTFLLRPDRQGRRMTKAVVVVKNKKILDVRGEQVRMSDKIPVDPEVGALLPKCFYDYTCTKDGSTGLCANAGTAGSQCVFNPVKKVSLEVVRPRDCATCKRSVDNGINFLSRYFPGAVVTYTNYPGKKAEEILKKTGVATLPLYLFDRKIENEDVFESIRDKFDLRDGRYIVKPGVGGISYYTNRPKQKGKLDLFVSLFEPGAKEVLSFLKEYRPDVHVLAVQQGDGFDAAKGIPEVEEYLRCVCVQKYYPQNFMDYLMCRSANPYSSWWEDCTGSMDTAKIKICAHGPEGAQLLRENIGLNRELQIMFGPAYLKDNQEIFASRGVPDKEEFLRVIGNKK